MRKGQCPRSSNSVFPDSHTHSSPTLQPEHWAGGDGSSWVPADTAGHIASWFRVFMPVTPLSSFHEEVCWAVWTQPAGEQRTGSTLNNLNFSWLPSLLSLFHAHKSPGLPQRTKGLRKTANLLMSTTPSAPFSPGAGGDRAARQPGARPDPTLPSLLLHLQLSPVPGAPVAPRGTP